MRSVSAIELREMIARGEDVQLIDVREPFEHEHYNIGGKLIPLGQLMEHANELDADKTVVVYCEKGIQEHQGLGQICQRFYPV